MRTSKKYFAWLGGAAAALLVAACSDKQPDPTEPAFEVVTGDIETARVPADAAAAQAQDANTRQALSQAPPAAAAAAGPIIRSYRNSVPWFGENRDNASILSLGKVLGTDYFIQGLSALSSPIPSATAVVFMPSNGFGLGSAVAQQNAPAAQANLAAFLQGGGVVIVDMGDNVFNGGFRVPGAAGTPSLVFPSPNCRDATLTPAAAGPDGVLGTADDHPMIKGPDGVAGTADDLNNSNIDMVRFCSGSHGNLNQGITLPAGATILATMRFGGVTRPVLAEYCFQGVGRVILDTFTKEFTSHPGPQGQGSNRPTFFMRALFAYALSPAASCNRPPVANAGPDQTLEWVQGLNVTLDGTGSSDPDADPLTFEWKDSGGNVVGTSATVSVPLSGLGTFTFTLTVTDPSGATDTDQVDITAEDTTAPVVTAALVPVCQDDDNGDNGDDDDCEDDENLFRVEFSCSDACDTNPTITVTELNGIAVANGQIVELELEDDDEGQEVDFEDGILQIEASSFELMVECVDASGNVGTATAEPVFTDDDDDDEGDGG